MPETCIFLVREVCNRQTIGIGRHRISTSVNTLITLTKTSESLKSIHVLGISDIQFASIGRHSKMVTRMAEML